MPKNPRATSGSRRDRRADRARGSESRPAATPPAARALAKAFPPAARLALAALAVVAFYAFLRATARAPWSYDEYYHLAIARELWSDFPLRDFRWTPFSILADHYADKEVLFHLLLMPFARLPLETAGLVGVGIGQVFVVGAFAWVLWRNRVPRAHWLVLALAGLGPMVALRFDMCRPHLWQIGFSILVLGLLAARLDRWPLAVASALAGLAHTGGWISIGYAALFAVTGYLSHERAERRLQWRPVLWAVGGWLAGQVVHPNVPENFRLTWIQNVVVPLQSAAGIEALRSQTGTELTPPEPGILAQQWPAFVAPAMLALMLLMRPRLRTRATIAVAVAALAFLLVGSFVFRRFFELGAPLALLGLGLALAERKRQGLPRAAPGWGALAAALAIGVGVLWTFSMVRQIGFGRVSPPRAMARWMGDNAQAGARVFTAQWADSAPLLYEAPQLQSLVALDPTFFWAKDPELFRLYDRIVDGGHADPATAIRERFGARYVTLWKVPTYQALATSLGRDPRVSVAYNDPLYLVVDLGAP